jgi:uncharacterized protein YcfJ
MEISMTHNFTKLLCVAGIGLATQAAAQVTFYEGENFRGRAFTANQEVRNFERFGFNDRASSAVVERGRWQVCEDRRFEGRCVILRRGNYPTLAALGLSNSISSVRPIQRMAEGVQEMEPPPAVPLYDYRVRPSERTFQAPVISVRAVVGPPERRCWVERQQVGGGDANVGGAIVGGILGGVLGHQIGSGRGNDAATAGGAIAGAAIGANAGRGGGYAQDVERCRDVPAAGGRPEYWDVEYDFRGQRHRVQMQNPPGPTVTVNGNGEPRG